MSGRRKVSSNRWPCLAVRRIGPTTLVAIVLLLGVASVAAGAVPTSSCIAGTGASLPADLSASTGSGCPVLAPAELSNASRPTPAPAGAYPVREGPSGAALGQGTLAPATPGAKESLYWYSLFETKTTPRENCWQAGEPADSSYACDSVGASFLPTGPRMKELPNGVGTDIEITQSGDYCNYYHIGQGLDTTDANKESGYTGYEPPTPLTSYQESNHYQSVCQAYETFWGHELRGSDSSECKAGNAPCGLQHYASLAEQGLNDRPWSSSLGEPTLMVSVESNPWTQEVQTGAWGYICPDFEDASTGDIIEFCMEEWRHGTGFPGTNEQFDVTSLCASADNHYLDQTITDFASGTSFATESSGSASTFVFGSNAGWRHFTAGISEADLKSAIKSINATCSADNPKYSLEPKQYALIGIEHGVEGGGLKELGAADGNLQLWSEYTELRPTTTTEAATSVEPTGATLNGTVNPNATDTHYYFQYGTTTSYGYTSPAPPGNDAGSGIGSVHASTTLTGLQPGTTYHYRLLATNAGGTSEGFDQTLTTPAPPSVHTTVASGVQEEGVLEAQATLNGTVTPNSLDTHYYFQYGVTIAYGTSVPAPPGNDAGSGTESVPVRTTITGLPGGTNYHYRLVANNAAGTTYGADQAFSTPLNPSVRLEKGIEGHLEMYVEGPNHSLWQYWPETGKGWHSFEIAGENTTYSTPYLEKGIEGHLEMYVEGPKHTLWQYWPETGKGWHSFQVSGENAVYSTPYLQEGIEGHLELYVQGPGHSLWQWWPESGVGWHSFELGGENTTYSTALRLEKGIEGHLEMYVQGPNHTMWQYWPEVGKGWHSFQFTGESTAYSNPYIEKGIEGHLELYVQGPGHSLWQWWPESGVGWHSFEIAGESTTYSTPYLQEGIEGHLEMYLQGSSQSLWQYWPEVGKGWHSFEVANNAFS